MSNRDEQDHSARPPGGHRPTRAGAALVGLPACRDRTLAQSRSYTLDAQWIERIFDDTRIRMRAYNGTVPGPTLEFAPGDTLDILVRNRLTPYDSSAWWPASLFVLLTWLAASSSAATMPPAKIVFLLQYVGSDYSAAVREGRVVNAFEYAEMLEFTEVVEREFRRARPDAEGEIPPRLAALRREVREKAPPEAIRASVDALVPMIADELGVRLRDGGRADLVRGRGLFASDCAPCHGPSGAGDGPANTNMDPPATSFQEARMQDVSPSQIGGAVQFGIAGTAMPSFAGVRTADEVRDVAFYTARLAGIGGHGVTPTPAPTGAGLAAAWALENAITSVADEVFPAVVGITALARTDAPVDDPGKRTRAGGWQRSSSARARHPGFEPVGAGSGFLLEPDGTILTARHFLIDPATGRPAERVEVELADHGRYLAVVRGVEPMIDLAVLEIDVPFDLPVVTIVDPSELRVGQWIIALGDVPGTERTFTVGSLSAMPRRECYQEEPEETLFQTSLWIEAGGFGGPVVDLAGRVIGIAQPRPGHTPLPGMPTALRVLPIELAQTIYESLSTQADSISPWLGFSVLELSRTLRRSIVDPPRTGVYIDDVHEPSPASQAGVREGDVLVSLEGNRILSVAAFQQWLYRFGVGKTVELELQRAGKPVTVQVPIEQRPAELVP